MSQRSVLINGTVVTGYGKLKDCGVYINEKGQIGDIFNMSRFSNKHFPPDTTILDAGGGYITPGMIDIFRKAGESQAIAALEVIYAEEVAHVAYGSKWFNWLCGRDGTDPKEVFHALARRYFHGTLKPPFNEEKRADAGMPPDFYWPLTEARE